jgi:stage IV sporulation protein FB
MFRFSFFRIPVGVHFTFLFIAVIVGVRGSNTRFGAAAETTAILIAIFAAVLAHEAGHAFTARHYGASDISITLFALGGVTSYRGDPPLSPGRRFMITAAGSAAGIVVGGSSALLAATGIFDSTSELFRFSGRWFIFASLGWGLLNWIPIRPLDGGQMLTAALEIVAPRRADFIARVVTAVVGGAIVAAAFAFGQPLMGLYVAFIAMFGMRRQNRQEATSSNSARSVGTGDDERSAGPAPDTPPDFPI